MKCKAGHEMILKTAHTGGYYDAEDYLCPMCDYVGRLWETGEMQQLGEKSGKENKEHTDRL